MQLSQANADAAAAASAAKDRKGKNIAVYEDAATKALRTKPTGLKIPGRSSQPTTKPSSKPSSQHVSSQLENRKIVNLCQPFVTPRATTTSSHQKSFTKYKPEAPKTAFVAPQHTSFSLAAYKAAKAVQQSTTKK